MIRTADVAPRVRTLASNTEVCAGESLHPLGLGFLIRTRGGRSSCHSYNRGSCECQVRHKYATGKPLNSTPRDPASTTTTIVFSASVARSYGPGVKLTELLSPWCRARPTAAGVQDIPFPPLLTCTESPYAAGETNACLVTSHRRGPYVTGSSRGSPI